MPELLILQGFLFSTEVQKDQILWSDKSASDVLPLTFLSPKHLLQLCRGPRLFSFHLLPKWTCLNPNPLFDKRTDDKAQGISTPFPCLNSAAPASVPKALASLPQHKTSAGSKSGKTIKCLKAGSSHPESRQPPGTWPAGRGLSWLTTTQHRGSQRLPGEARHQLKRSMNQVFFFFFP